MIERGKKVCIIGGAGYIGSRLVPELMARGYDVVVVDVCWFGEHLQPGVKLVLEDVLRLPTSFFNGFSAVFFLAGLASDPMAEFAPALNFIHNVAAPAYAAHAAKGAGVERFIYADSCSVYGDAGGAICTEDAPTAPVYPYGISKAQGNVSVMHLVDDSFSVIALRQGTLSGWSPRMRFDLLINTLYKCAAQDGTIVANNPAITRPLLVMKDAITAYITALEAPKHLSGTFNIASRNVTVGEVAEKVVEHFKRMHGKGIVYEKRAIPDLRNYRAAVTRAQEVLGLTLSGTVESVLDELDEHIGPSFDFSDDIYYNIRTFKKLLA